ncbi:MAG: ATP-grasp domain-containing protein [Oceanicoccus sp.]|uniref:carboxylate--amine ligase n=1 Tax=Oceanicoccus sp. TaxID=2691044 RepID=UPI00262A5F75|nr:ATP-grasp domain-containing protein [Oceanicoccus sp.]MDG1772704.1 ATP-grasp domain-containing protein [Oceanicoccus sp.]
MDEIVAQLSKHRQDDNTAWIFGASVNGLSFVRSLGRKGIKVILIDGEQLIGSYSNYCDFVLIPNSLFNSNTAFDLINKSLAQHNTPPIIFATSDYHIEQLSIFESKYPGKLSTITPNEKTAASIVNKKIQYTIAKSIGIEIPETYFPNTKQDALEFAENLGYPFIIKPYIAHEGKQIIGGKKVVIIDSLPTLKTNLEIIANDINKFMLQEIIPGDDNCLVGYLGLWSKEHKEVAYITKQKLRQNPPLYGDGSYQITTDDIEVTEKSRKLLGHLNYQGYAGIEFKIDNRNNQMKLMEINPRTVSGNQLPITAGVDFPWIGYNLLKGRSTHLPVKYNTNTTYVNEEWDLKSYIALKKSGKGIPFFKWLHSVIFSDAKAIWAIDDLAPFLETLRRIIASKFRKH